MVPKVLLCHAITLVTSEQGRSDEQRRGGKRHLLSEMLVLEMLDQDMLERESVVPETLEREVVVLEMLEREAVVPEMLVREPLVSKSETLLLLNEEVVTLVPLCVICFNI